MNTFYRVYLKSNNTRYGKKLGNGSLSFKQTSYTAFKTYGEAETAVDKTSDAFDKLEARDFEIESFRFCACGCAMERGYNYTCKTCSDNRSSVSGSDF